MTEKRVEWVGSRVEVGWGVTGVRDLRGTSEDRRRETGDVD